jgi:parallel beta-helix repeat protein
MTTQTTPSFAIAAAFTLWLATSFPAVAAQFFVATSGNDAAAGSAAAPWRTLQKAASVVNPGDVVNVRPGNYAGFNLTRSGSPTAPISFLAAPGVLIDQANPVRTDQGINLENASHIIIDGFSVTGMARAGIRSVGVDGSRFASHVTIRNVHSYNNGYWGILTGFVHDLVIENNELFGSVNEHGIYVSNSGDRPVIRNNVSWGNRSNGIHVNGDAEQGGDGIISGAQITGNIIYDNGRGGGSGINMDGVQNSRIENNLIYGNHASGISLYRIDGGGASSGNVVANNTIYQAADARWALNVQNAAVNNTVRNNILLNQSSRGAIDISADSLAGFTSDYNVVKSRFTTSGGGSYLALAQWQAATGQDLHSIESTAAQLFVNPAASQLKQQDYHLLPGAVAVNAGTSFQAPSTDIDGNARPFGASYDIGADEWGGAASADFNGDGAVDAADYVALKNARRTLAVYQLWRANFGATIGTGTAVGAPIPEPAALVSVGVSVAFCLLLCQPRRSAPPHAAQKVAR